MYRSSINSQRKGSFLFSHYCIANTFLFTLTSFNKQFISWKVLEICELCALSNALQKTYSVNTLVAAAIASTEGGGITEKTLLLLYHANKFTSPPRKFENLYIDLEAATKKMTGINGDVH